MPRRRAPTRRTTTRRRKPVSRTITIKLKVRPYRKRRVTESSIRKVPDYAGYSRCRISNLTKSERAYENMRAARYRGDSTGERRWFNELVRLDREQIRIVQREAGFR